MNYVNSVHIVDKNCYEQSDKMFLSPKGFTLINLMSLGKYELVLQLYYYFTGGVFPSTCM